jgi:hypothetical protein
MKSAIAMFICSWALGSIERQSFICPLSFPLVPFEKKLPRPLLLLMVLVLAELLGESWKGLFWGGSITCTSLS